MLRSRAIPLLVTALAVPLAVAAGPADTPAPATSDAASAAPASAPSYRTAAELPDELLDLLPTNASEAGLAYAPRLVSVTAPTRQDRQRVVDSGLDVTEHAGDDHIEVVLHSVAEQALLESLGYDHDVVTPDMIALEHERIQADAAYFRSTLASDLPSERTTYRVLADYGNEIDDIVAANPDLAKRISVGTSVEGRDLVGVEIGVGVNDPEDGRPVFLMFGAHHAREWPSAETPMEFAHDLVETFNAGDERTIDLLGRARVIIVPVSNPDGYDASRTSGDLVDLNAAQEFDPLDGTAVILATPGNAYKRKNCRVVNGQTQPAGACVAASSPGGYGIGIDLNRNYGALWGGPGAEGDPNTVSPIYRGPAPFSEPETEAIRRLISTRQVTTLISNHTFSNLLLRPVGVEPSTIGPDDLPIGFAPDECFEQPDGMDNGMQALGERMTAQTGYSNQFGWELYDTTGTTEDYSYNATGGYGYTFEIGPEQFHPPFEDVVAEYTGETDAAQAVTEDNFATLTSAAGRDCGEKLAPTAVSGGLREAYFIALENAANSATHSVLEGTAPFGAEIGVTRTGTFPLWDKSEVEDTVATTMTVDDTGSFAYHVNPSTRPFSDSRPYTQGPSGTTEVTTTSSETRSGTTLPPGAGTDDVPIEVPAGTDALLIDVTADVPIDDYDIELISPDLVTLDSSANGNTDEHVEHIQPNGIQPGEYVLRIINFAAVGPWNAEITLGTVPDQGAPTNLQFSPRTTEEWTVTCTIDDEVLATRDVVVDRGQSKDLGSLCGVDDSVTRLDGDTRFTTAVQVAGAQFGDDEARAVVLARGDDPNGFADALAGGPLAVDVDGPLLITDPDALRDDVAAEIDRVLPDGGTVYLLGGDVALAPAVEQAVKDAGYRTARVFGETRYDTAVAIADLLGNPELTLLASGETFPDALSASAAAVANTGAVLLTTADQPHPSTVAYLEKHDPERTIAVGGPAARAFPDASDVVGQDRYATAIGVAELLFEAPAVAGLARGDRFPDALSGASHVGRLGGPILLTPTAELDGRVGDYLCANSDTLTRAFLYGGTVALADAIESATIAAITGSSC